LNLKQGTSGELFGYGYLPLPLTPEKKTTAGKDVPTGNQCWTLFLNTGNFKGPVAFFTPYFWSKPTVANAKFAGKFLDTRPADPNKAVQMETQYVPCFLGTDAKGQTFARLAPTSFPRNEKGDSVVVHRITAYKKEALWDGVKKWFDGGEAVSGTIDVKAAAVHKFSDKGGSTWRMYGLGAPKEKKPSPAETGLANVTFGRPANAKPPKPYVTPEDKNSSWKSPGPSAGPFTAKLGDGSTLTYFWYRFADQPTILNADLTDNEREELQKKVEKIHRHWKKDREYLPPNTVGTLADLDPGLLVVPPKGLEVGYVPIVTRQGVE
jgi:hypothetical protein